MSNPRPTVLFLCTGNAARSVMGAALVASMTDAVLVASAGTHSIPGLPMSVRTRSVLDRLGAADPDHRSAQVVAADVDEADMIVIFEPMHLKWLRANLAQADGRAASLARFCRDLKPGPSVENLAERVAAMGLAGHQFEPWEEVIDPAGGDQATFDGCGAEIAALIAGLVERIGSSAAPVRRRKTSGDVSAGGSDDA